MPILPTFPPCPDSPQDFSDKKTTLYFDGLLLRFSNMPYLPAGFSLRISLIKKQPCILPAILLRFCNMPFLPAGFFLRISLIKNNLVF
jgi:hypothetical protein